MRFGSTGSTATTVFLLADPCQRCIVPTRNAFTGETWLGFEKGLRPAPRADAARLAGTGASEPEATTEIPSPSEETQAAPLAAATPTDLPAARRKPADPRHAGLRAAGAGARP